MIQLTFQPAFDTFHTVFRFLRLRAALYDCKPIHRDHIRIIDFFLLFPFRVDEIRLAPTHRSFKKLSTIYFYTKPYGQQPTNELIFNRMKPMQIAALETLASHSLIDQNSFQDGNVQSTRKLPPQEIQTRIDDLNNEQSDLIDFLKVLATAYELAGPNGLKARTGLLEYRYDAT